MIFIDKDMYVVHFVNAVKPWKLSPAVWKAESIFEMTAESVSGKVVVGDKLCIIENTAIDYRF